MWVLFPQSTENELLPIQPAVLFLNKSSVTGAALTKSANLSFQSHLSQGFRMQVRGSASSRIRLVSFWPWKAQRDPKVNVQQHWAPCSHFSSIRNHKGSEREARKRKWADNESGPRASLCIASEELAITSCETAQVWQSHTLLPFCNKPPSRATGRNLGELINGGWTQQELMLFISASNSPWAHRALTGNFFSSGEHESSAVYICL